MKLAELKNILKSQETILFELPDGKYVPKHFHVTEVGKVSKNFIDCGGTVRNEEVVSLQLWSSIDYNHRLHPEKLLHIIELSESKLGLENAEIEVEYQGQTIQKYGLDFDGSNFLLTSKHTDCLAKTDCLVPVAKIKQKLSDLQKSSCCSPSSGCC